MATLNNIPTDVTSFSISTFFQLQEEERHRLARTLMNGPGQILANTLMELEHFIPLIESEPTVAMAGIAALREEIRQGLTELKGLLAELQPPLLIEMGLGPSVDQYLQNFGARNDIQVQCDGCDSLRERLPSTIETAVFRIVQEALSNVVKHSGATRVRIEMARVENQLRLEIQDNGRGFVSREGGPKIRQLGIVGMRDRADLVGGQLQIFSGAGQGVRVVVTIPYHADDALAAPARGGQNENGHEKQNGHKSQQHAKKEVGATRQSNHTRRSRQNGRK